MTETLEVENSKERHYPWHLLRRTALLLNAYLGMLMFNYDKLILFHVILSPVCGLSIGVVGPTLLDLKDLVGATLGQISFILMMNSIGSLVGCFSTGFLLDKFLEHKFLILGGMYRVSQKKLGLVFRGHFRPSNGRKSKKARKQTPPKIKFYLLGGVFRSVCRL